MPTATKTKSNVIRLPTQHSRAVFVRQEMRRQNLTVEQLAKSANLCEATVRRFCDLPHPLEATKDPRSSTLIRIFQSLGYDIVYRGS